MRLRRYVHSHTRPTSLKVILVKDSYFVNGSSPFGHVRKLQSGPNQPASQEQLCEISPSHAEYVNAAPGTASACFSAIARQLPWPLQPLGHDTSAQAAPSLPAKH